VILSIIVGLLSQGTGVFGGLILLDKRENTYCVPVNRASSILAGLVATYSLALILGERGANASELIGAALIIAAILVLSLPPLMQKRKAAAAAANVAALPAQPPAQAEPSSSKQASGT